MHPAPAKSCLTISISTTALSCRHMTTSTVTTLHHVELFAKDFFAPTARVAVAVVRLFAVRNPGLAETIATSKDRIREFVKPIALKGAVL